MENRAAYESSCLIREDCLRESGANWLVPNGDEIKCAIGMAGWTGVAMSKRLGVDPRTVRRWTGNEKPIPYAAWCVLCFEAGLGVIWK